MQNRNGFKKVTNIMWQELHLVQVGGLMTNFGKYSKFKYNTNANRRLLL